MLPQRIPKPPKRASRWRSQAHLSFVRSHRCCVRDCNAMPIEAAHVRNGSGAGIGRRPDDHRAVSLCRDHHAEQHRLGEETFWRTVAMRDVEALIIEFCRASPKRLEIEAVKKERGL